MLRRRQARDARAELEEALGPEICRWPIAPFVSRLLDIWIILEEAA